jgi:hypothetical protein
MARRPPHAFPRAVSLERSRSAGILSR